jgi:ribulose-5-phosphate 4-epimerase/fuculose-1-phosphate aldolase
MAWCSRLASLQVGREVFGARQRHGANRRRRCLWHVSVRHPTEPNRFLLSRSRSPRLVDRGDIMQFDLEGGVIGSDNRPPYSERFIHAALYAARADAHAIAHGHAQVLLPFAVTDELSQVTPSGSFTLTPACSGFFAPDIMTPGIGRFARS